jgi:hypothetical protein
VLSQEISDAIKLTGSLNWYNNHIDAFTGTVLFPYERPFHILKSDEKTWDAKFNGLFNIAKDFQAQVTAIYYAPKNVPQGRILSRSSLDLGLKKTIIKGKGEITYSISDIFYRFGIRQEIVGEEFTGRYENNYETQVMRLGFRYKF